MAFSGGTFSRTFDCTTDRDNGVKILASKFDTELDGFATGLSTCILKDGTQTCTAAIPFAEGLTVPDNKTIILGTNSDITIQYDETTNDSLEIAANVEGAALGIVLKADQGDDNADQHKLNIADGGVLTLGSKISGSFVDYLTHTPNSTVASSTTAVAGNLTVGGDLTLGSGAVISEAELEAIDGVTAGTVTASKAVIVDSNKDIASFRNVTLTGELDAGSLDISGDADIDGTLETDALSIASTVVTATAAELNYSDTGAAVGTVVASKVVTADANKDVASFRNITLTGELDAGSLDISGDADIDGTLEADAMTLAGTAITTTATLSTGISNNNVPVFTSGVADDDFLRVAGTAIEGRSASEVLSDIGGQASLTFGISNTNAVKIDSASVADDEYARFTASGLESRSNAEVLSDIGAAPAAGSSNIVTTGALNSGSITSGFGSIDTGSSAITTTGVITGGSLDINGAANINSGTTDNALTVVSTDAGVNIVLTDDSTSMAVGNSAGTFQLFGDTSSFPKLISASNSAVVINEDSNDTDFRVESNGNANMLFVDGGNDTVGIGKSSNSSGVQLQTSGNVRVEGLLYGADGSASGPSIRFFNAASGLYHPGSDALGFVASGSEAMRIDSSGNVMIGTTTEGAAGADELTVGNTSGGNGITIRSGTSNSGALYFSDGTSGAAEYDGGFEYSHGSQFLRIISAGSERVRINSSGNVGIGTGTITDTSNYRNIHIEGTTGTIMRFMANGTQVGQIQSDTSEFQINAVTSDPMVFKTNNTERMRIDSSGLVGIGVVPSGTAKLQVNGQIYASSDGTASAPAFAVNDGDTGMFRPLNNNLAFTTNGSERLRITNNGYLQSPPTYTNVTAAAANVHIEASVGQFFRSTSSRRYKNTINDATHGLTELLALRPVTYKGNNDGDTVFGGLIAEEVHDSGLTEFVQYNDDNEPDALSYGNMVSLCIKAIQEQQTTITKLEARIAALENA